MLDFKELYTKHTDTFKDMAGIDATVGNVSAKLKELGYSLIIDDAKNPGYISKTQFDEVNGQKDQLKAQADDFSKQLETLKTSAKGNEALTKTIEDLQKQNDEIKGKYKNTVLDSAIKLAAINAKAKNPDDVLAFVDRNKLVMKDDGTIEGLGDQLKGLTESKAYLFGEAPAGSGANPPGGGYQTETEKVATDFATGICGR